MLDMTIALLDDISRAQGLVAVDHPDQARLDEVLKIDDEYVVVRSVGARLILGRGALGSERAEHLQGATLSPFSVSAGGGGSISATDGTTTVDPTTSFTFPAGTLSDLGAGVAGVGLVVTQVGPFRITFDQADWANVNSVLVAELPQGAVVLKAWLETVTGWNGAAPDDNIGIGLGANALDYVAPDAGGFYDTLINYVSVNSAANAVAGTSKEGGAVSGVSSLVARVTGVRGGLVVFTTGFAAGTAGASDIYAIIATPAA